MTEFATAHISVRDFASAVRAQLDDLPPEEVDELTDGLEADLTERVRDAGDSFGNPADYAEELRSASGLPARERPWREPIGAQLLAWRQSTVQRIRSTPSGAQTLDFFVALRPVWWVLRGWVFAQPIALIFGLSGPGIPTSAAGMIVLIAAVILSVQWGRGRWLTWRWLPTAKVVASVIAAILLLPLLAFASSSAPAESTEYIQEELPQGLFSNGSEVRNIFAYDCAGDPLTNVQLFTADGDPLNVSGPDQSWTYEYTDAGAEFALVPNQGVTGSAGWNVFPLDRVTVPEAEEPDLSTRKPVSPPFSATQPLADGTCAVVVEEEEPSDVPAE